MRLFVCGIVVACVAACSSSSTPTGTKSTPPPPSSVDTLLTNGSIPAGGGTLTINKPGDPLNGLTMTVASGAFPSGISVTMGSSSNKNLPTGNGIVPISPVVHVTSGAGYAKGSIVFKIPVTVPANAFPVAVWYDSATKAMEPMTTIAYDGQSVTAMTGHLDNATLLAASRVSGRGLVKALADSSKMQIGFGVYALPASVLDKDWDTGFQPGTNDWELFPWATEVTADVPILLSVAATETWYFNTKASGTPLNNRFTLVKNVPLSDRVGYRWLSVVNNQVGNDFNSFASSAYKSISGTGAGKDSLQFEQVRASFALAAMNSGSALPVLVDLQTSTAYYYLVAYKATGNKIYVADPISPGDGTRYLLLGSAGMLPYQNANFQNGAPLAAPLATALGMAIPLSTIASSYADANAGTVGNALFPTVGFYSWIGQLYDTMYVVDTLRFWGQCAQCQYGFSSTLSPPPSGNVASSYNLYFLQSGLASDSIGYLSPNGLLLSTNPALGASLTLGLPLASAASANAPNGSLGRWLDWQQVTIARLQATMTPDTPEVQVNSPQTLQVSVTPNLLPSNVAYQWNFGDSTAQVTVQNSPTVQHSYAKSGKLQTTVQIIDNRNAQVIAQDSMYVTVDAPVELWVIQSFTYLYTVVNGNKEYASDSGVPKDSLAIKILPNTVPTLVALNGPPFPNANWPLAGFAFASPPDSAQEWASVSPQGLAISAPYPPFDITAYSNTGTATSGTITGQAIESSIPSGTAYVSNVGYSVNLVKKGSTLSGYVQFQGSGVNNKGPLSIVVIDSVVATRVPYSTSPARAVRRIRPASR